jgi:hypothetical protein
VVQIDQKNHGPYEAQLAIFMSDNNPQTRQVLLMRKSSKGLLEVTPCKAERALATHLNSNKGKAPTSSTIDGWNAKNQPLDVKISSPSFFIASLWEMFQQKKVTEVSPNNQAAETHIKFPSQPPTTGHKERIIFWWTKAVMKIAE